MRACACVRVCVRTRLCVCVRALVCVRARACMFGVRVCVAGERARERERTNETCINEGTRVSTCIIQYFFAFSQRKRERVYLSVCVCLCVLMGWVQVRTSTHA